jgi:hypothetical protein
MSREEIERAQAQIAANPEAAFAVFPKAVAQALLLQALKALPLMSETAPAEF